MKPGSIIRYWNGARFTVWRVTGIYAGATGQENLIGLESLSEHDGTAHGELVREMLVPEILLSGLEVL